MKYIMQFGIIASLSLVGEVLNSVIPLPVPASVWGMVLLKLDQVSDAADFLLSIMTITFVPVGASLLTSFPAIRDEIVGIFAIIIISTLVCFFVTGKVAQKIIDSGEKKSKEE